MYQIKKYFALTPEQEKQFKMLPELFSYWNERINVISRKDIGNLEEHHILHSLAIAKFIQFVPETKIMDVGTGGGFPGIPLAIMFPEVSFLLVDSIGKKIKVVNEICAAAEIKNIEAIHARADEVKGKFDFVVSRAVTELPAFYKWVSKKINTINNNPIPNGILYLKGGDVSQELLNFHAKTKTVALSSFFEEEFFATKLLIHIFH